MQWVERALQESTPLTVPLLKGQLAGFEFETLRPLLQQFVIEAGTHIGGGAVN